MKSAPVMLLLAACVIGGCSATNDELVDPQRLENGLVVILPGIEGEGALSYNVRQGLNSGGVNCALPIYRWGRPIPIAGPILNQMDVLGNRAVADRIAQMITDYQDAHPGKPVYLVGHSGGGGVAVFTAEAMPEGRQVDGLILLSASISQGYDLSTALSHCSRGIVNFYSSADVGLLVVGTTLTGNVDGVRGPAAGAHGFDANPPGLTQIGWSESMSASGNYGGHMDSASARFVEDYVAPWLRDWRGR